METKRTTLIEAWFRKHNGDGEFLLSGNRVPYSVMGSGSTERVVYTTKPSVVAEVVYDRKALRDLTLIGRYGLPDKADLRWIRKLIGRSPVLFLGDLDPVDILVFVWLSEVLRPQRIVHFGINDSFLRAIKLPSSGSRMISCAPSEQESLMLLKKCAPDLERLIGKKCCTMLDLGQKMELEIIAGKKQQVASALIDYRFSRDNQTRRDNQT